MNKCVRCSIRAKFKGVALALVSWILLSANLPAAEWQWSVKSAAGRAFLWIPPDCQKVRAVVVAQNNRGELGILEHVALRQALAKLDIAEVWITPPLDDVFRFDQGAGDRFDAVMKLLADDSGYGEVAMAPVIPMGEALCASYPWNFAAWDPARTLAVISIHGDAPLTDATGGSAINPSWGARNIDGVPGLMVMAEYEWQEDRILPALEFRKKNPRAPFAMLAEPGHGHFEYTDELVNFLAMFIRKAAEMRLPASNSVDQPVRLTPIDPQTGWLVQRWSLNRNRDVDPAPVAQYKGDPLQAFWCFDQEMAEATQNYGADQVGKKPQLVGFVQMGAAVPANDGTEGVDLRFLPLEDGISFKLGTEFLKSVEPGCLIMTRWTGLPVGTKLEHSVNGPPILISKICGPVKQTGPETFCVSFDRSAQTADSRNDNIWLMASQAGGAKFKRATQQALLRIAPNSVGADQNIFFPAIADQKAGTKSLKLAATSDSKLPVSYYVREGPAEIEGDTLLFTGIPPRSKMPIEVTVLAWQWGRSIAPSVKTAPPVERSFLISQ